MDKTPESSQTLLHTIDRSSVVGSSFPRPWAMIMMEGWFVVTSGVAKACRGGVDDVSERGYARLCCRRRSSRSTGGGARAAHRKCLFRLTTTSERGRSIRLSWVGLLVPLEHSLSLPHIFPISFCFGMEFVLFFVCACWNRHVSVSMHEYPICPTTTYYSKRFRGAMN